MALAYDGLGRPLQDMAGNGFTSTIMEPLRGSQAIRYPGGECIANTITESFQDNPGQNGSGGYTLENGDGGANFYGGKVDSNVGYWMFQLGAEIVEVEVGADDWTIVKSKAPVTGALAAQIAQNQQVTVKADGQSYDFGKLTRYLVPWRGGAAQQSAQTFDTKLGWTGLADNKVAFSLNPGNTFSIQLRAVYNDRRLVGATANELYLVRWTILGVKWLQGGAAQKR